MTTDDTTPARVAAAARALFEHDWMGTVPGMSTKEASWVMNHGSYMRKAAAVVEVLDVQEHAECSAMLEAAGDEIERLRAALDAQPGDAETCGCGATLCQDWREAVSGASDLTDPVCGCGSTVCRMWRAQHLAQPGDAEPRLRPAVPVGESQHSHGDWIIPNDKCPWCAQPGDAEQAGGLTDDEREHLTVHGATPYVVDYVERILAARAAGGPDDEQPDFRPAIIRGLEARFKAVLAACELAEAEARHVVDDEVYVSVGLVRNALNTTTPAAGGPDDGTAERALAEAFSGDEYEENAAAAAGEGEWSWFKWLAVETIREVRAAADAGHQGGEVGTDG